MHDRWFSESCKKNKTAAANIIWHDYMKKLQICNHNKFNLHIFMIDAANNLLHNEFKVKKWFWSLFVLNTISQILKQQYSWKKMNKKNYNWHTIFVHVWNFQHVFKCWDIHWLFHELYTITYESHSAAD